MVDASTAASSTSRWPLAAIGAALSLALLGVYLPGLQAAFLFDDFVNLPALGRYGGVHDLRTLSWYLTSGIADPTGRPVAMLSFLIDARDWPADPWPFLRTNLAVHVINASLLLALLLWLGKWLGLEPTRTRWTAAFGAAAWALHPLWVSTVLYVIQRQAMLATTFVLCGLLAWLAGQRAFAAGRNVRGWIWCVTSVAGCGLLAGFSKANGFLLPLLVLVMHCGIVARRPHHPSAHARAAFWMLAAIPAVLSLGVLWMQAMQASAHPNLVRDWSMGERLLSQPRAICDYLGHLLLPGRATSGVFADSFPASRGLFEPLTTVFALCALVALVLMAWRLRRSRPAFATAVGFYFFAHAMESTIIPLELYFEHRNYLPAVLLFWGLATCVPHRPDARRLIVPGMAAFLLLAAAVTWSQAMLWADPLHRAQAWAALNPTSARAQTHAANEEERAGLRDAAIARLAPLAAASPSEPQYSLNLVRMRCEQGLQSDADLALVQSAVASSGIGSDVINRWLIPLASPGTQHCPFFDAPDVRHLITLATAQAADNAEMNARAAYLQGLLSLRENDCVSAEDHFAQQMLAQRRPEFLLTHIGLLGTHCGPVQAKAHLEQTLSDQSPWMRPSSPAHALRDWLMARDGYWENEWSRLRRILAGETLPPTPETR